MKTENIDTKKVYAPPFFSTYRIEIESSIANSSAEIEVGKNDGDVTVEDWQEQNLSGEFTF